MCGVDPVADCVGFGGGESAVSDDTFTFQELRITLTAFAMWFRGRPPSDIPEVDLVDQFLEEEL